MFTTTIATSVPSATAATTATKMLVSGIGGRDCGGDVGNFVKSSTVPNWSVGVRSLSYRSLIAVLGLLLMACSLATVNGLKCHMCGQYNEGVGSITPCLNYSDQHAHLYLRECTKKSEKFCVKYVSELSTVRDCATECVEKEIWETQTWCCNTDGCNGTSHLEGSQLLYALPLAIAFIKLIMAMVKVRR